MPANALYAASLFIGNELTDFSKLVIDGENYRLEFSAYAGTFCCGQPDSSNDLQGLSSGKQLTHTLAKSGPESFGYWLIFPALFVILGLNLYPTIQGILTSFTNQSLIDPGHSVIRRTRQLFQAPEGPSLPGVAGCILWS